MSEHGATPLLHVAVLGPLSITRAGEQVPLGGALPRALVARLVLARGTSVTDATLVDDLWGDDPPADALGALHTYVSRIRRVLAGAGANGRVGRGADDQAGRRGAPRGSGSVLQRTGPGYVLRLPPGSVDACRFEELARSGAQLLGQGRAAQARQDLLGAQALWRGEAYADVVARPFAAAEAHRLEQLRVGVAEGLLAAAAQLGDPGALAALEAFVVTHPLRERGWQLLAGALDRAGRQAEALAAIGRLRAVLAEELGADPSPDTVALEASIAAAGTPTGTPTDLLPTTNLPLPLTAALGRAHDVEDVSALLRTHRVVTVTGAGGAGKTRLALETAYGRHDDDGPWLVELADADDGRQLPSLVAGALGLRLPASGGSPTATDLARSLTARRCLLVLDNAEHLLDDVADLVTTLVRTCPQVSVLVTSREILGTHGESVYEVAPLDTGPGGPAVALFCERAAAAGRPVTGADDLALVQRLCSRLDGLPLAIEMAAGAARSLPLATLEPLLRDRLALPSQRRSPTPHHVTMRAAVQWSWDLLSPVEQDVFTALAVFEGGFTVEAAGAVVARADTVLVLADLVAKSMVVAPRGPTRRYRVLEVLRQFAAERTDAQRRAELSARHLAWVLGLARGADLARRGQGGPLGEEGANVRAALGVADPAGVALIGVAFAWCWMRDGRPGEGLAHLLPALAALEGREAGSSDHALLARAWIAAAGLHYPTGDIVSARAAIRRAEEHSLACDDPLARAQTLVSLCHLHARAGRREQALEHGEQALRLARACGARATSAEVLDGLGEAHRHAGDVAAAVACYDDAVAEADGCGHRGLSAYARWHQGWTHVEAGDDPAARAALLDCLQRCVALGESTLWLLALAPYTYVLHRLGDDVEAVELAAAVDALGAQAGLDLRRRHGDLARQAAVVDAALPPDERAAAVARGRTLRPGDVMRRLVEASGVEASGVEASGAASSEHPGVVTGLVRGVPSAAG